METQYSTLFIEMNFLALWCLISVLLLTAQTALLKPVFSPELDCSAEKGNKTETWLISSLQDDLNYNFL